MPTLGCGGYSGTSPQRAEDALIRAAFAERDLAGQEAARRCLADLRAQLAGPDPSPLERVLAERAALALYDASRLDAEALSRTDLTWQTADLLDRRRTRAHARALAAVRSLAVVRRLLKGGPAVAVGVQVNVGRGAQAPEPAVAPLLPGGRPGTHLSVGTGHS